MYKKDITPEEKQELDEALQREVSYCAFTGNSIAMVNSFLVRRSVDGFP